MRLRHLPVVGAFVAMLSLSGSTSRAQSYRQNLLVNPGAEDSPAAANGHDVVPITGWTAAGGFTIAKYGTPGGLPGVADAPPGGGSQFFWGGTDAVSNATQTVNVLSYASDIDVGLVSLQLSADMSGYAGQGDNANIAVSMLNATGQTISTAAMGPQSGGSPFTFVHWNLMAEVKPLTRFIVVQMQANRVDGSDNDAYFDNVTLSLNLPFVWGDVNGNGSLDGGDAAEALKIAAGLRPAGDALLAADVAPVQVTSGNRKIGDQAVDMRDAVRIIRAVHNMEKPFP